MGGDYFLKSSRECLLLSKCQTFGKGSFLEPESVFDFIFNKSFHNLSLGGVVLFFCLFFFLKHGLILPQADLKFTLQPKLALNSQQSSNLSILSAGITSVSPHTQLSVSLFYLRPVWNILGPCHFCLSLNHIYNFFSLKKKQNKTKTLLVFDQDASWL